MSSRAHAAGVVVLLIVAAALAAAFGLSCRKGAPPARHYAEVHADSASALPVAASDEQSKVTWQAPAGWIEHAGTGMRLAAFDVPGGTHGPCTLVRLAGDGGGLRANVARWCGQLGLPRDERQIADFVGTLAGEETEGRLLCVVDFRRYSGGAALHAPSMLAGVISLPDATVFAKLVADPPVLESQYTNFVALCRSVR